MWYCIFLILNISVMLNTSSAAPTLMSTQDAYNHLMQFGYGNAETSSNKLEDALESYQSYMGLNKTGLLDEATKTMMLRPRCGVPDKTDLYDQEAPQNFMTTPKIHRRHHNHLTYRINKYATDPDGLNASMIDRALAEALQLWSAVTPLRFVPKATGDVDIAISFERKIHADPSLPSQFDGPGNVLAHAYLPKTSTTHFDDDERWAYRSDADGRVDLVNVATHEFGHALGLLHSDKFKDAVMFPMYNYKADFKLHSNDVAGIREIYGSPRNSDAMDARSLDKDSELCKVESIDTAFTTPDGSAYVLKGDQVWKLATANMIAYGYPQPINYHWPGLPSNINASFSSNNKTYFFKRSEVWRYTGHQLDRKFPQQISKAFPGIDSSGVDLAFIWSGNGKTYFFKGDKYYRYLIGDTSANKKTYPKPISDWGLPNNMDAAMAYYHEGQTKTYFFKGRQVYKYNDKENKVHDSYPQSTGERFFGCLSNNSSNKN